jgi:hypothetical protein
MAVENIYHLLASLTCWSGDGGGGRIRKLSKSHKFPWNWLEELMMELFS